MSSSLVILPCPASLVQAARLQREFTLASEVLRAERERAQRAMTSAADAANASLRAMSRTADGGSSDDDLRKQLRAAAAEAERWRHAVEELQQMQDVVVIELQSPLQSSAGGAAEGRPARPERTVVMPYRSGRVPSTPAHRLPAPLALSASPPVPHAAS